MKTVLYTCPFVPAEWIAAHALHPARIMPASAGQVSLPGAGEGICPFTAAFFHEARSASHDHAVIVTTVCDQMRRMAEWIENEKEIPVFLFNVPATWESVTAQKIYRSEVRRLGRFLVRLGGKAPSDQELARVILDYDAARTQLRDARGFLAARAYSEAIADFVRNGPASDAWTAPSPSAAAPAGRGVPLALVGGPLLRVHLEIFDMVEQAGGDVVLDATGTGERVLAQPLDRRAVRDDPFNTLVDACFGAIPDAFRRPNTGLYAWLKEETEKRGVRGIIFDHHVFCDTWHGEARRLKEWSGLPVLILDTDGSVPGARTASRIQAFLEVLS